MSRRAPAKLTSLATAMLVASTIASAHHGDAGRYNQDVITITGTVVNLQMVNPHGHIFLDVTQGGKTVRWQAELPAPQPLVKQFGWTPSTIKAGMTLTMIGRPLRSGAPFLNLTERANIVMTDTGKEIYRTDNFGQPPPQGPKGTLISQP